MAGYEMCIAPPTTFDITSVTVLNNFIVFPVAQRIDVSRYEYVSIGVRCHTSVINGGPDGKFDVYWLPDGFTPDDPSLNWQGIVGSPVATINTNLAQSYTTANVISAGGGPGLISVVVKGTRLTNTTTALSAKLSIDMSFRSGSSSGGFRPGGYMGYGGLGV